MPAGGSTGRFWNEVSGFRTCQQKFYKPRARSQAVYLSKHTNKLVEICDVFSRIDSFYVLDADD